MNARSEISPVNAAPMGRRRVLTAAAWTVPAVVVASAAPAFAGSASALPSGLNASWMASVQIERDTPTYYINRDNDQTVAYRVRNGGALVPSGTYFTDVFFTLTWNVSASLTPVITNANGWSLAPGSSLAPGAAGTALFVPDEPLFNGADQALTLPQIQIDSTVPGVDPSPGGTISTLLSGTNLGGVNGGITI